VEYIALVGEGGGGKGEADEQRCGDVQGLHRLDLRALMTCAIVRLSGIRLLSARYP
jgi:hypothetical protein